MPPLRTLLGVVVAFTLTQLPVDELKVKLLRLGALSHWGALLSLFDLDQQQVALGALVALGAKLNSAPPAAAPAASDDLRPTLDKVQSLEKVQAV